MTAKQQKLVSVRVDADVWQRVRLRCVELEISAASVVEAALVRWLDDPPKMGPATNPHRVSRGPRPSRAETVSERVREAVAAKHWEKDIDPA